MYLTNDKLLSSGIFFLALLFFLGLAAGPFPVRVSGILLDRVLSALVFVALLLACLRQSSYKGGLFTQVLGLYFLFLLPSVILAEDIGYSVDRFVIDLGYGALFYLFISSREIRVTEIRWAALFGLLIIELVTVYLYNFSDYSDNVRFALSSDYEALAQYGNSVDSESVDPNTTAIGMVLTFLCAFPLLLETGGWKVKALLLVTFSLLIYSLLVLSSRTAIVAIILSMLVFFFHALSLKRSVKKYFVRYLSAVILAVGFMLYFVVDADLVERAIGRFFEGVVESESQSSGRLDLIETAFGCYFSSVQSILFGCGYSWSNPHNEFIKNLTNSGFFAAVLYVVWVFLFYVLARKRARQLSGTALLVDATFIPLLFSLMTYGHTKTFWAGLAIVWIAVIAKNDIRNVFSVPCQGGRATARSSR